MRNVAPRIDADEQDPTPSALAFVSDEADWSADDPDWDDGEQDSDYLYGSPLLEESPSGRTLARRILPVRVEPRMVLPRVWAEDMARQAGVPEGTDPPLGRPVQPGPHQRGSDGGPVDGPAVGGRRRRPLFRPAPVTRAARL